MASQGSIFQTSSRTHDDYYTVDVQNADLFKSVNNLPNYDFNSDTVNLDTLIGDFATALQEKSVQTQSKETSIISIPTDPEKMIKDMPLDELKNTIKNQLERDK